MSYYSIVTNKGKNKKLRCSFTVNELYDFWCGNLFERLMRLFEWKINEEEYKDYMGREIETTFLTNGSGLMLKKNGTLVIMYGTYGGKQSDYFDMWDSYCVRSPYYSKVLKINDKHILGKNNSTMSDVHGLVRRYAMLLAHTDVTYMYLCVNARESSGIPIASTESAVTAIENYRSNLMNGTYKPIADPGFATVSFIETPKGSNLSIKDITEVREDILQQFYRDIGVKANKPKKGNLIAAETSQDDGMLLLNINDMLHERQLFCEKVNKAFGTNWSVDINSELKKAMEDNSDGVDNDIHNV